MKKIDEYKRLQRKYKNELNKQKIKEIIKEFNKKHDEKFAKIISENKINGDKIASKGKQIGAMLIL